MKSTKNWIHTPHTGWAHIVIESGKLYVNGVFVIALPPISQSINMEQTDIAVDIP